MTAPRISQQPEIDSDGNGYTLTTVTRTHNGHVVRTIVIRRPAECLSRAVSEVFDHDELRWRHVHSLAPMTWYAHTPPVPDTGYDIVKALSAPTARLYAETAAILTPPPGTLTVLNTTAGHPVAAYHDPSDARHAAGLVNSHLGFTMLTPTDQVPIDPDPDSLDGRVDALSTAQTIGVTTGSTTGKENRPA